MQIIKPVTSPWSFPVLVAMKKKGNSHYVWTTERQIREWRLQILLPKLEEVIDDIARSKILRNLDIFAGYFWLYSRKASDNRLRFFEISNLSSFKWCHSALWAHRCRLKMSKSVLKDLDSVGVYIDTFVKGSKIIKENANHLIALYEREGRVAQK